jgi:hypothetical protein
MKKFKIKESFYSWGYLQKLTIYFLSFSNFGNWIKLQKPNHLHFLVLNLSFWQNFVSKQNEAIGLPNKP